MKVKALRRFRDINTKKFIAKGNEFEITQARFKEINGTKFGTLVEDITPKKPKKKAPAKKKVKEVKDKKK